MNDHRTLERRGRLAIALTIGFYTLAIGLAATLLFFAYAMAFWVDDTLPVQGILFCVVGAGMILWSIVPRRQKFEEPGPRLHPYKQRELFAVLRDVAKKTGQEMPHDVYLIPDVNAYVMHYGRRRIMGLGLTLMESLSVDELRAVVAHEFGHYAHGDVKHAAWVYRTAQAMERTVDSLQQHSRLLDAPFKWYAKLFMRITQEISRAQELAADRLAARVTSRIAAASALIASRRANFVYLDYLNQDLGIVLSRGYRPPVARGFAAFASAHAPALDAAVAEMLEKEEVDPADSHPPLRDRLRNLGVPATVASDDGPRATSLLADLESLEASLIAMMWNDPAAAAKFTSISWEEAAARAFIPLWQENVKAHADALANVTPVTIGSALPRLHAKLQNAHEDDRRGFATSMAGSALAAHLYDQGWVCEALPGKPVRFSRDGKSIEPFHVVYKLQTGELTAAQWEAECRAAGLAV